MARGRVRQPPAVPNRGEPFNSYKVELPHQAARHVPRADDPPSHGHRRSGRSLAQGWQRWHVARWSLTMPTACIIA